MAIPAWFQPWVRWKLLGGARPAGAPERIPDWAHRAYAWFVPWGRWVVAGRPAENKPRTIPREIPEWARRLMMSPKIRDKLRDMGPPPPPDDLPDLGPVVKDGPSILDYDLTHATGGLSGYPAFDAAFNVPGKLVIAPEKMTVTRHSSARRRDGSANGKAFYATGASGLKYWFGHVEWIPPLGDVSKGAVVGKVSANHEVPHVHVGVNAEAILGHELEHHTNYTHGSPTIGDQLA